MITTPKHPQIEELIRQPQESSKVLFSYEETYKDYLIALISDKLFRKESVLITVEKLEDITFLIDKSSPFHSFVHIYNRDILPIQSVSKLRVRAKKNTNLLHVIDHEHIDNQLNAMIHDVHLIYGDNYGDDKNNIKLSALLQQLLHSKVDYHLPILEFYLPSYLFSYSKSEFSELQELIDWASVAYDHNYAAFTKIVSHVSKELTCENFLNLVEYQLGKANELCLLFLNNLNDYKELQNQDLDDKNKQATGLLEQIRGIKDKADRVNKNPSHSKGNILSKIASSVTSKQLNPGYQESMELDFDAWLDKFRVNFPASYQEFYMLEESTLLPNIDNAEKILSKEVNRLQVQLKQSKDANIEQLNIHNCPEIFKSINQELNTFYAEIQETETITISQHDRSFNLINNYEFLLNIRNELNHIFQLISKNSDYYNWVQTINKFTPKERGLLDTFIQFFPNTAEWSEIFESYYFHSSIQSKHKNTLGLENKLESINALYKRSIDLSKDSIESVCNKQLFGAISALKRTDPELYKAFFKKKYVANNHNFANGGDLNLLKRLFPITVILKDDMEYIKRHHVSWDFQIHLDTSKFQSQKESTPQLATKYMYIKYPIDEYYVSENLKQENTYVVKHDVKEYIKHPKLQTDQDQLNFARSLSSKLEDYLARIQIFQIEDQYIISFLDKKVLGIFLSMYEKYTIKKFVIDHDLNYSLSDILLAGMSNITVLVQDHLLDPYAFESFQWQRYLIQLMNRAGLKCKDISYAHIINKNYDQLQIPIQQRYSINHAELHVKDSVITD